MRATTVATLFGLLASILPAADAVAARPQCDGKTATIVGTERRDVLVGTPRNDVIVGRGGNDRLEGRGGNDVICGGAGSDWIVGHDGADRLYGLSGRDRIRGGNGKDRIFGYGAGDRPESDGNDHLDGGPGRDHFNLHALFPPEACCSLDPGDDVISDGEGASVFHGSTGSNEISGYGENDWVVYSEPVEIDLVEGLATHGGDTDFLYDIENVHGSEGDDIIVGDEQANVLFDGYESSGADQLYGNTGNDSLITSLGDDVADGGPGDDGLRIYCCVELQDGDDSYICGEGRDYIHAGLGGADSFDGGDGYDVVAWNEAGVEGEGVIADLEAGRAEYRGQTSTLQAFEELWGTAYADELYGDAGDNAIHAGFGDDLLDGRDGTDYLDGALGEDRCLNGESFRRCESMEAPAPLS